MQVIKVYFDGGTIGVFTGKKHDWQKDKIKPKSAQRQWEPEGGDGYGSWEVCWNGFSKKISRMPFSSREFGQKVTSNVAEYLSLMSALFWMQKIYKKADYHVHIFGDSQLVLKTLEGTYKLKAAQLIPLRDRCLELLNGFGRWQTEWQGRKNNVARFGH